MKRLVVATAALVGAAGLAWAGPPRVQAAEGPPGAVSMQAQRQQETAARAGRVMSQTREMDQWMQQRQVRAELRHMNEAMERACERIQMMAQRMEALADAREYKNDEACCRELDRFQSRLGAMTREMEEAQNALRLIAEREGKTGEAPIPAEQAHVGEQQRDMEGRMEPLSSHVADMNAWMVEKQSRKEFQETGRDMNHVRDRLQVMLRDMIQIRQGGTPDRGQLREMDRLQDRLDVMMREMMEAHESLTELVNAP